MEQEPQEQEEPGRAAPPKRRRARTAKARRGTPRPPKPPPPAWHNRGRLALIELEPLVERMLITGCSRPTIDAFCMQRGATEDQVGGLVRGIKARWLANQDATQLERRAEYAAQLDAAIHDAWHRPIMVRTKEGGVVALQASDGTAVTQANTGDLARLLKLKGELHGLNAPSKHVVLHGEIPAAAAMTPVERQAEIDQLLARRAAALAANAPPPLPAGKVIDVEAEKSTSD